MRRLGTRKTTLRELLEGVRCGEELLSTRAVTGLPLFGVTGDGACAVSAVAVRALLLAGRSILSRTREVEAWGDGAGRRAHTYVP